MLVARFEREAPVLIRFIRFDSHPFLFTVISCGPFTSDGNDHVRRHFAPSCLLVLRILLFLLQLPLLFSPEQGVTHLNFLLHLLC